MRRQLDLWFTAQMFYTRLPVPAWVGAGYTPQKLTQASAYFPVVGWLVGAATAGTYWLSALLWSPLVAVLLSTAAGILLTGAFHEDGLADVCDGLGGGWTTARILEIMKDSRVGTYGLVGLGLTLAGKVACLHHVATAPAPAWGLSAPTLLLLAHPLSRLTALGLIRWLPYARLDQADAKAKPIAQGVGGGTLLAATVAGLAPLLAVAGARHQPAVLLVLLPLTVLHVVLGRWFRRWLAGYTGDCLGATQQLAEVVVYLFFAAG